MTEATGATGPVDPTDRQAVIELFCEIAVAAGEAILAVMAKGAAITIKADESPVTEADHASERVILAGLRARMPQVPVIAEEEIAGGHVPAALGRHFVLVDPLDGTKEFIKKNGEFCVLIGLIEDGRPSVGVVLAPQAGLIWAGAPGLGAFKARVEGSQLVDRQSITVRTAPVEAWTAVMSRSHGHPIAEAAIDRLPVITRTGVGSAIKFAQIAEGIADVHARWLGTNEWDTAAGEAVVVAAGGAVIDYDGNELSYAKRGRPDAKDFTNPGYAVIGAVDRARVVAALQAARDAAR